jgi:hypothetical protein
MDERKRIQINPDFFKIETTKKRTRRAAAGAAPPPGAPAAGGAGTPAAMSRRRQSRKSTDALKTQLLRKIREQQHKERFSEGGAPAAAAAPAPAESINEFENSLLFFKNITNENKRGGMDVTDPHQNVSLRFPEVPAQIAIQPPAAAPPLQNRPTSSPEVARQIQPQHGCLKGGTLPTYRTWATQKNYHSLGGGGGGSATAAVPPPSATGYAAPPSSIYNATMAAQSPIFPPAPPTFGAVTDIMPVTAAAKNQIMELMNARERAEQNERAAGPMKHKKTVRRTYQVGRSKKHPVVSVLVSNKTIRKKTMTDIQNLGQVPMHEVKNFLQKKGLIKIGSVAPPRVLRKMYENVFMLGGDIVNHNKDTLLHNFIMGAREENQ